ncbi:hypothetical protein FRB93_013126 [Tulasnella sp. JGI-2019a]|nr:hypothetical protein FRB93_013126 [Tulasnella sp. JGI-2019a]
MSKAESDEDEDDYLSEKFLNPPTSSRSGRTTTSSSKSTRDLTYAERRREAQRISDLKNQAGRTRSRRDVEEEARREGLSRSLFERAREEEEAARKRRRVGSGDDEDDSKKGTVVVPQNKAMAMMLKMGFKEGESLGRKYTDDPLPVTDQRSVERTSSEGPSERAGIGASKNGQSSSSHLVEPLPLAVWAGRKGLGLGKRTFAVTTKPPTPSVNGIDPKAKESQEEYRARVREEFQRSRDAGRVVSARKTLVDLDEKNGVAFNILWIDPQNLDTISPELLQLIDDPGSAASLLQADAQNHDTATQLRAQMQKDALQPLESEEDPLGSRGQLSLSGTEGATTTGTARPTRNPNMTIDEDTIQDTKDWLQLNAQDRLRFTLQHLRSTYYYCFWCGAKYEDAAELKGMCPGEEEEAHD